MESSRTVSFYAIALFFLSNHSVNYVCQCLLVNVSAYSPRQNRFIITFHLSRCTGIEMRMSSARHRGTVTDPEEKGSEITLHLVAIGDACPAYSCSARYS